ncbi:hypothetical protein [Burkholderia gladioli]|uniref:hypothetical protein n=1 Tax=Burkholderia gladioli TaxID=28095 RepID=UPI001640346B|nr:hypothetical protein [Burkholderia gladioli]
MEQNAINPLLVGNSEEIARRVVEMIPKAPEMTPEQAAAFEKEREEGRARYQEVRFGELPADTYRVLDYGSFLGWYYALEVDGEEIILKEEEGDFRNEFKVHGDTALANQLAKAEIAKRYGAEVAERARFAVVWGGTL